ncbi:hypothetical protein K490DRAFT_71288 [Saccharata proteae CBS 121410]|uniref:Zn(2)-C6 fungal-type domain-containing protein n=1 Tax=Saccharata proteae CBS 121410 TaxID=1314787 RepID=A0A9P4I1G7_9PEZI|nr:hypothetical protein K490DRAFT_71288 [Saccharata proteae CBS 121410]
MATQSLINEPDHPQSNPHHFTKPSPTDRSNADDNDNWSRDESSAGDDNAPRKRKRPMSVSCELCKQRKVKCDRGQPSCGWCVRNNQLCEYKERKKPGLRAGYGRELESRLDRLEDMIHRQQTTITHLANNAAVAAAPSPQDSIYSSTPHIPKPETALFLQKPSQPTLNFSGSLGLPSTPAIQHTRSYSQPMSHGMRSNSITGLQYSSTQPPIESPSLNLSMPPQPQPMIGPQEFDFPPYDLLYALADLFFRHINTWCPILHRRTTLDALFGSSTLDEADRILLHAIVATTLRFSTDARLTKESRERYHSTSKQKVLLYGLENSSVKALQALVILALDLVGYSNGPPGWNLLALITRSVVQLGLSVETTSTLVSPNVPSIYTLRAMILPEPKDFIEDESRRRLFWVIYLLDRYATVATAFEFALDEKEIDRKLPCRDELFARNIAVETRWFRSPSSRRTDYTLNKPENLGAFSYYVELIGILSQIHQFLKKPVDIGSLNDVESWQREFRELDGKLSSWKFGLPSEMSSLARVYGGPGKGSSNGGDVDCGWVMLHAAFFTTTIRLHSSAAYPTTRSPIFTPSYTAIQRCLAAVEGISSLCAYVRSTPLTTSSHCSRPTQIPASSFANTSTPTPTTNSALSSLGPPFAFALWVAARVLLVHGSTVERQRIDPQITPLVETLGDMGRHWRVAERYRDLLMRVLEEYRESQDQGRGQNQGAKTSRSEDDGRRTPSSVRILADMRRCAFDLDFLISRQPLLGRSAGLPVTNTSPGALGGSVGTGLSGLNSGITNSGLRTPAANELEYLDVFDFFNVPRLPFNLGGGGDGTAGNNSGMGGASGVGGDGGVLGVGQGVGGLGMGDGFNITNFMVDASADWFGKD